MKKRFIAILAIFVAFSFLLIFKLLIFLETPSEPISESEERTVFPSLDSNKTDQQIQIVGKCKIPKAEKIGKSVSVSFQPEIKLNVKGIIFPDVFEWSGASEFSLPSDDPECRDKRLEHAMDAPSRIGANWIGIVAGGFYKQVNPLPVIGPHNNDLSLTDEEHYSAIVNAAKQRGFKVAQTDGVSIGPDLSQEQINALKTVMKNPEWWDEWFKQYEAWLIPRAIRAEKYNVDMLVIYAFADDTCRQEVYPQCNSKWREIISKVRQVYSGKIAMNVINAEEYMSDIFQDLDALLITVFGGLYTSREKGEPFALADKKNPTLQELITLTEDFFYGPRTLYGGKLTIYFVFTVTSTDGQEFSEEKNARGELNIDFEEQALYYEAFFRAMEDETWISGFFSERWDWFDQYKRPPEGSYYDETGGSSPRNKPAEDVIKIWYNLT